MPRPCTICNHPERIEIEASITTGAVPQNEIAKRFGFSPSAISRHKPHMIEGAARHAPKEVFEPPAIVASKVLDEAREIQSSPEVQAGQTAYFTLMALKSRAERGLEQAEHAENDKAMAFWFRELRSTLELIFKVGLAQKQLEEQQHKDISPELQSKIDQVIGG